MSTRFRRSSSAPARMQPQRKSRATKTTKKCGMTLWHVERPGRSFLMKYSTTAGQRKAKFKAALRTTQSNKSSDDSEAAWSTAVANAMRARAPVSEMLGTPPSARGYVTQPTPDAAAASSMDNLTLAQSPPIIARTPPPTPVRGQELLSPVPSPFAASAARVWSQLVYDTPTKSECALADIDAGVVVNVANCGKRGINDFDLVY